MIGGVFAEDNNEYVNHQKKIRDIIVNLKLEKASMIGIDRREFYRLKKKLESDKPIVLRKKILDKIIKK
jgi:DNA invertase Pin-like site-specific DNA recombinase